jgi:hypothetical protein
MVDIMIIIYNYLIISQLLKNNTEIICPYSELRTNCNNDEEAEYVKHIHISSVFERI